MFCYFIVNLYIEKYEFFNLIDLGDCFNYCRLFGFYIILNIVCYFLEKIFDILVRIRFLYYFEEYMYFNFKFFSL